MIPIKHLLYRTYKLFFIVILPSVLSACTIGEQGVFYAEISKKPILRIQNNKLRIEVHNSNVNSAQLIYEVNATINQEEKVINLKAKQAINKDYLENFEIDIPQSIIKTINLWTINWVDPDGTIITLEIDK
ncbi:hypothetical protein EI427_09490 [Flammeovirga pectinis]|uniref:Lipoprotein n=1 Tax=Flammeovirga pectinis TaxID=2494373 RepID=A0A3S9P2N9_9BACT|nr:hypothetical protein [Flammeovirga pectinis]AZQ62463.1 hypothetical protein EI427_09490 [Flammeovirga pectinis]